MNQTELQDEVKILRGQVHCYTANLRRLQRLNDLLTELEAVQQSTGSGLIVISKDSPSGNGEQSRLQLIEDLEFCRREIEVTQYAIRQVNNFISCLKNKEDKQLIRLYAKGWTYQALADQFGYTDDGIDKRLRNLMKARILKTVRTPPCQP